MSTLSKLISSRLAVSQKVIASLKVHGPEVWTALLPGLAIPEAKKVDLAAFGGWLVALLSQSDANLEAADLAHSRELADDVPLRNQRDIAAPSLRIKLGEVRDVIDGLYGKGVAARYGLPAELPELPADVQRIAGDAAERLTATPIAEKPRHAGLKLDAKELAKEIAAVAQPLDSALSDLRREEREAQVTLATKNRAVTEWGRVYQGVTHIAYGLYLLADQKQLADRIEPTARRRAGIADEPDDSEPGPTEPSSADPDAPAKS